MTERWRRIASSAPLHCALLALPFLVGILLLKGLTAKLPVHQGNDEWLHYSAILAYARQLPLVDLRRSYGTSSGPLMYYVYGAFTRLAGAEIYKLRLLNTLVSYLTTLTIYFMLRRVLSTPPAVSFSLAAVVGLSPYLFGQTFIVLTDNFMYLWMVLALAAILQFVRAPVFPWLLLAAVCTALALLTRQFAVWLVPTAAIAVWISSPTTARRWAGLMIVAAACVPLGLVMLAWGGLVEPASGSMAGASLPRYFALSQGMALVGLYTITLIPLGRLKAMIAKTVRSPLLIGVAIASLIGLALDYIPQMTLQFGYLGLIAAAYPALLKTSVVYWILTPVGAVFLVWALSAYRGNRIKWLAAIALVFAVLTSMASSIYFQRYIDVAVLVALVVLISGDERVHLLDFVRWWLLAAAFVAWVFAYVRMAVNTSTEAPAPAEPPG